MSSTLADKSRAPPRRGETKLVSTTKSKSKSHFVLRNKKKKWSVAPREDCTSSDEKTSVHKKQNYELLADLRAVGKEIRAHSLMVEYKTPPVMFRGSSSPAVLAPPPLDFTYEATPVSNVLQNAARRLFGDRRYPFRLSTVLNMSSSGAGIVNAVINTSTCASLADFTALSGVFNEFFITRMDCIWEPASMYNGPVGYLPASTVTSLPLGAAQLQHFAATYSTVGAMSENYDFVYHNTGRPFTYSWKNVEKSNVDTVPETAGAGQGWQPVIYGSSYSGSIQFLTTVLPTLPASAVLGTFFVSYDCIFRLRD